MVKTIDSHIYDLKDDLITGLSSETANECSYAVNKKNEEHENDLVSLAYDSKKIMEGMYNELFKMTAK